MTSTISRPALTGSAPISATPGGTNDSQQATPSVVPTVRSPAGANSRPANPPVEPIPAALGGPELAGRQRNADAQDWSAASVQPADRHVGADTQSEGAVGSDAGQDQAAIPSPSSTARSLFDPALALAADVLDDIERVRTANENRLRQLTRSVEDSDGEVRGFGLDESHPDVARLSAMVAVLKCGPKPRKNGCCLEHDATKNLEWKMREHPLGAWVEAQSGVGKKQAARLLAAIGDPYINSTTGLPRTVSALWAYCGLHVLPAASLARLDAHALHATGGNGGDPGRKAPDAQLVTAGVAPKRQRGQRANWSTIAKTRAYLIATSCLKRLVKPCTGDEHVEDCVCSPYRRVYDQRRAHTAVTHPEWTDGHAHNDALRVMSKAILRDLWREAKRIHESS